MVTGASTADVAVVLLDARKGVVEQTRRHSYIAATLGIQHLVFAVNKMDLVRFDRERFDEIAVELRALADKLGVEDELAIPISALNGDNVVGRSDVTGWYEGPTLLEHLETVEIAGDRNLERRRFPVQWVIRPMSAEHHDYRGYAGQVAGGVWRAGDDVLVLPAGLRTKVMAVEQAEGAVELALPGTSVTVRLEDDVDVGRGDMLCDPELPPVTARQLEAAVCWMSDRPLQAGARLAIKHTTRSARAVVDEIRSVLDVQTLEEDDSRHELVLNDIGTVALRLSAPLAVDRYAENRTTGSFILIDEASNDTVAAGMIRSAGG
jgi:bifunctional enzyme CysN/CysC